MGKKSCRKASRKHAIGPEPRRLSFEPLEARAMLAATNLKEIAGTYMMT